MSEIMDWRTKSVAELREVFKKDTSTLREPKLFSWLVWKLIKKLEFAIECKRKFGDWRRRSDIIAIWRGVTKRKLRE